MSYTDIEQRKGVGASLQSGFMAVLLGLSLIAVSFACAAMIFMRGSKHDIRRPRATEKQRDDALKETFPASDTPASQYFDIPVNRL